MSTCLIVSWVIFGNLRLYCVMPCFDKWSIISLVDESCLYTRIVIPCISQILQVATVDFPGGADIYSHTHDFLRFPPPPLFPCFLNNTFFFIFGYFPLLVGMEGPAARRSFKLSVSLSLFYSSSPSSSPLACFASMSRYLSTKAC